MSDDKVIKIFHSEHCQSCNEVTGLIKSGNVESDITDSSIELIDILSDTGYNELQKDKSGIIGVPTAVYQDKICRIGLDRERSTVVITCQNCEPEPPVAPEPAENKES
jgi:glutaredoxin-related protein